MQCKDIPTEPIIALLESRPGVWHSWYSIELGPGMPTVREAFPVNCPDKLVLAKMRSLVRRGLVEGCPCGCRGDFHVELRKK